MVGDHFVAEEIVSETMLALVSGISRLDPESVQLHSWLRAVVRHKVADYGRQKSRQSRLLTATAEESEATEESTEPSASLEASEQRERVLKILDRLSGSQRSVLEWKHVDGLSVREIAERTGQTEKSVESTMYRGRKEFRRLYELSYSSEVSKEKKAGSAASTLEKSL